MNKKILLVVISLLTLAGVIVLIVLNNDVRYEKLVVDSTKWNSIKTSRVSNQNLEIGNIKFNDISILVDSNNNKMYYSYVNNSNKFNPLVDIDNVKIVFDRKIDNETSSARAIVYNDSVYKEFTLVVTDMPLLNIKYDESSSDKGKRINATLNIYDNHVDAFQNFIKLEAKLLTLENDEYRIFLKKESLGGNTRKNHISIFGMEQHDEYVLKKGKIDNANVKYVNLFINDEDRGVYSLEYNEGRNIRKNDGNK